LNIKVLIMAGLAVSFGAVSYFAGNHWLDSQAKARVASDGPREPAVAMSTVVVAAEQVRFGQQITAEKLKEVPWPANAVPEGAFKTIAEITAKEGRRAIKTNRYWRSRSPAKTAGPGFRASSPRACGQSPYRWIWSMASVALSCRAIVSTSC
jgi:pilus assembly protein CpaB